jgi:hypothetical protein
MERVARPEIDTQEYKGMRSMRWHILENTSEWQSYKRNNPKGAAIIMANVHANP